MTFVVGFLSGLAVWAACSYLKGKQVQVKWYHWLMAAIGLLLILLNIEVIAGSLAEGETRAAWMSLIYLGLPALVIIVLFWRFTLGDKGHRLTTAAK